MNESIIPARYRVDGFLYDTDYRKANLNFLYNPIIKHPDPAPAATAPLAPKRYHYSQ